VQVMQKGALQEERFVLGTEGFHLGKGKRNDYNTECVFPYRFALRPNTLPSCPLKVLEFQRIEKEAECALIRWHGKIGKKE